MSRWTSFAAAGLVILAAGVPAARAAAPLAPGFTAVPIDPRGVPLDLPTQTADASVEISPVRVQLQSDVLFAFGSARLTRAARSRLVLAARDIRGAHPPRLTVVGHTDHRGGTAYNLALSLRRAAAVRSALAAALGGAAPAMRAVGRGEVDPLAAETKRDGSDDPRARARNRRVAILFR